jgi:ABC-2 type transport system ATP-binding protein
MTADDAGRAAPEPSPAVVRFDGVVVRYGKQVAVPGLDLAMPRGSVGLLGPNGAGKSTLIKAMLGLVRASAGSIEVLGLDVARHSIEVRRRVGYMPESAVAFPSMTGFENVAYAGQISGMPRGEARRRAHEVLEYVGCGEERYRAIEEYSQGMRQRVKLASALVHDPDLVLLDEPTNGLDPSGRVEILHLVRDLGHEQGVSVVLSSHLLDDVESVCDHVVVLARGEAKASGSIAQLEQRIAGETVRLTVDGDATPFVEAARARGLDAAFSDALDSSDCLVRLPPGGDPGVVLRLARECGVRLRRFVPRHASLEEVFLETLEEAR